MAPDQFSSSNVSPRGAPADREVGPTIVWLRGEYDFFSVAALSATMDRAIALNEADLVVDLGGVRFMDAAMVGVVVRARELLRRRSRSLSLRSPSRCQRRVLDVCGLGDLVSAGAADLVPEDVVAGALATWVAVPATPARPTRVDAPVPASAVGGDAHPVATRDLAPVAVRRAAAELSPDMAGRGGP